MKSKLLLLALLVVAFCLIIPHVSANALISQDKQTSTETEEFTVTEDLAPNYYPYTQVKISLTATSTISLMYNQVTDAKGSLHINGKATVKGTMHAEAWLWDDSLQVWVLGQQTSQKAKQFFGYNELILDSEVHTSKETRLFMGTIETNGVDLETGERFTLNIFMIEHMMFKLNDGELQFEKSWEISKAL